MDTDRFIVYIKAEDIYADIAKDVEERFDTSNYELDCVQLNEKIVIGLTLIRLAFLRIIFSGGGSFWLPLHISI